MRHDSSQLALPLWAEPRALVPADAADAADATLGSARALGSVMAVARAWGLEHRLARTARIGVAYQSCLDARVVISRRARIVAGLAYAQEGRIVLNAKLLEAGREADRNTTFLHECAHLLADQRYRRNCRHDWRWRRIMEMMGEVPTVSHRIAYLSREAHAVVTWACRSCGFEYHFVRRPRRRIADCHCGRCGPAHGRLMVKSDARSEAAEGPTALFSPLGARPETLDLAIDLLYGDPAARDRDRGLAIVRRLAEAGQADAQFALGLIANHGELVVRNRTEALQWFEQAAEAGHREARYLLALATFRGDGRPHDEARAIAEFRRLAAAGHAGAQYHVGVAFSVGLTVERNDKAGLEWLEKAAEQGYAEAQYLVGLAYTNGKAAPRDHVWAARWYGRAADQGVARAQYMLGLYLATGLAGQRDHAAAYRWLVLAAKRGDTEADRLRQSVARRIAPTETEAGDRFAASWRPGAEKPSLLDGPTVRFVQRALVDLGYDPGPIDGRYGSNTRDAVERFQAAAGLAVDGRVGRETLERLRHWRLNR